MASNRRWVVPVSLASLASLLACSGGEGTMRGSSTTGEDGTTGSITTFDPTTTIDPSDPTLTGSTSGESGSSGGGDSSESSGATESDSSSSDDGDSSSGSVDDEAPSVQSTTPADLDVGVVPGSSIIVEFSEAMDPATITADTMDGPCMGSVQVSVDGFGSCIAMAGAPTSADDTTFELTPANPLPSMATVQVRVLDTVTDAAGNAMEAEFTTATGFVVRYFHTITIDGIDDFGPSETLASSTTGHQGKVAWDADYLYIGMDSPDLAAGSDQVWMVAYLGGVGGGHPIGVTYNTQSPTLSFDARWHLRWRADGGFTGGLEWNGVGWVDATFTIEPADVSALGSFVEMRVPWTVVGNPDVLDLHLGLLREQDLNEASWAAVPASSYVDGYDPDYSALFQFDRAGTIEPASYVPMVR